LLGIARTGVARVRVRRVFPDEATRRALRSGRPAEPLPSIRGDADQPALARTDAYGYQPYTPTPERIGDPR